MSAGDDREEARPGGDTVVDPTVEAEIAEEPGGQEAGELEAVLAALGEHDLARASSPRSSEPASSAARAAGSLSEKLSEARAAMVEVRRLSALLAEAARELSDGAVAGVEATEAAVAAVRQAGPRTEEVAEVVDHLEEVAAQAGVAALNVSVEASRAEGGAVTSTVGQLAEEARRLADRGAAVARRMSAAVESLRGSWADAERVLEVSRAEHGASRGRAGEAAHLARKLVAATDAAFAALRAVRLPEDARAAAAAARLLELEARLDSELGQLAAGGGDPPPEVAEALERLARRIRGLQGEGP